MGLARLNKESTMMSYRLLVGLSFIGIVASASDPSSALSQATFNSGSNESLGALNPAANTTVTLPPDGILHYTTVTIPAGVTVTFARNAANTPVTLLASGTILISGNIRVDGQGGTGGPGVQPGRLGGPGGFNGGQSGIAGLINSSASSGQGPGGSLPTPFFQSSFLCDGGIATYGMPTTFVSLTPLFGGSGGGGLGVGASPSSSVASGAGGGGAIVLASSTQITLNGVVSANGGVGYLSYLDQGIGTFKGAGSGGAVRLVAPTVQGTGRIEVQGGTGCARAGRTRVEAQTLGGNLQYSPSPSEGMVRTNVNQLGPVWAGSTPALVNVPTLAITSVGGVVAPSTPGGLYNAADVALPPGTSNPVPVVITGSNIPQGTGFSLVLIPQFATSTTVNGTFSTGSTATVSINLPLAQTALLNAYASFTLPQLSKHFPLIDGEEVERVMVAGGVGTSAPPVLITKSGKEVPVAELSQADQVKVARAFEALRNEAQ